MTPRRLLDPVLLLALAACGGAVTDPLDEDPVPTAVLGTWHLVDEDGCADPDHVLVVERGVGVVFGHFAFPLFSQEWQVFFADAPWRGDRFVFRDPETYGLNQPDMPWEGVYTPERTFGGGGPDPLVVPEHVTMHGIRAFAYQRPGVHRSTCPTG